MGRPRGSALDLERIGRSVEETRSSEEMSREEIGEGEFVGNCGRGRRSGARSDKSIGK